MSNMNSLRFLGFKGRSFVYGDISRNLKYTWTPDSGYIRAFVDKGSCTRKTGMFNTILIGPKNKKWREPYWREFVEIVITNRYISDIESNRKISNLQDWRNIRDEW